MARVLVAGHVNWDVTLRVSSLPEPDGEVTITSQHRSCGGSAANVASALAGFDVPASLLGSVGDDEPGLYARRDLEEDGVDVDPVSVIEGVPTTVKYLIVDGDGEVAVLANEGANEAIGPDDVDPSIVESADHLHLTGQRPDTARRLAAIAAASDGSVSFDPGRRLGDREYGSLFSDVDYLFLNNREAVEVLATRSDDPADFVADRDRIVILKHGPRGATVYADTGVYHHPGFGVKSVDTSGAGDAFAAGFLAMVVQEESFGAASDAGRSIDAGSVAGNEYERALAVANACGALTARREGARTAPDAETVIRFVRDRKPIED